MVAFPEPATPGEVAQGILQNLALIYIGLIVMLGIVAAAIMQRFPIEQSDHEARIARMRGTTDPFE
jgi:hypothetical protein